MQASVAGVARLYGSFYKARLMFCHVPVLLPALRGGEGAFMGIIRLYVPRHKEEVSTQMYVNIFGP